ncbi:hypothetical protein JST97_25425 [bacterium]|nr:hypothetical protein [bacterium]
MKILILLLALSGLSWSEEVSADQAREIQAKLKLGMTRAQVEKSFTGDGGLALPFKMERYILLSSLNKPKVAKVTLQFRPAGMSKEVYLLGKWAPPRQKPGDVLMQISQPFLEPMTLD